VHELKDSIHLRTHPEHLRSPNELRSVLGLADSAVFLRNDAHSQGHPRAYMKRGLFEGLVRSGLPPSSHLDQSGTKKC